MGFEVKQHCVSVFPTCGCCENSLNCTFTVAEGQSPGLQLGWCGFFISGAGTVLWCSVLEELGKLLRL